MNGLGVGVSMSWMALGLAALATSCALEKKELEPSELEWSCEQGPAVCHCESVTRDPFDEGFPPFGTASCSYRGCCLLDRRERENVLATCECFATGTTCEQEAAARPGTEVVEQCPIGEAPAAVTCALVGEGCAPQDLGARALTGCCGELVCVPDAEGGRSCQVGSEEQRALKGECTAALDTLDSDALVPTISTVETSLGTFEFGQVGLDYVSMGAQGCITGFRVTLEGSTADCSLSLDAGTTAGKLTVKYVSAYLAGCPGFTGSADFRLPIASNPPFTFAHEGQTCTRPSGSSDKYCYSGIFDFHLGGTVSSGAQNLAFADQVVRLQGTVCGYPLGQCPAP